MIDNLDAVVLFVDDEGIIRHANDYTAHFLGRPREELEGVRIREVLRDILPARPDRDTTISQLLTVPRERRTDEIDVLRPGDGEACFSITRRAVRDADGTLLGVVVVGTDISERRETEERLARSQQALRTLGAELAMSEERQRRSIATRIHDEISQNLAYAKLRVGALTGCAEGKACLEGVSEINGLLDMAIAGSRALAFELSPPLLHELGFVEAVEWLVEQFEERHGIDVEFVDRSIDRPISPEVSVTLFRAISELLTNVVKHSGARRAIVSLAPQDGMLRVRVSDDGQGFSPVEALEEDGLGDGFGLFNISERLGYLGGSMQIESNHLTGTLVTLTAPLNGHSC